MKLDDPNREKHTYASEPWRAPTIEDGETIVFDEHGRDYQGGEHYVVCHCSHWFRLVKGKYGGYDLRVKHGGGEERHALGHHAYHVLDGMAKMSSDDRFQLFSMIHEIHREAYTNGALKETFRWRAAVIEKRIIRRKMPGRESYKVGIRDKGVKP